MKTFKHFKYQKLKRGEKSKGLLNIIDISPYIIKDYFVTFFLIPAVGKNKNAELEEMRKSINRIVKSIYFIIALITLLIVIGLIFN